MPPGSSATDPSNAPCPQVPKMMDWLKQTLIPGSRVGADPRLIGADTWKKFAEELESK